MVVDLDNKFLFIVFFVVCLGFCLFFVVLGVLCVMVCFGFCKFCCFSFGNKKFWIGIIEFVDMYFYN